jgi:hypothetical protein
MLGCYIIFLSYIMLCGSISICSVAGLGVVPSYSNLCVFSWKFHLLSPKSLVRSYLLTP